MYLVLHSLFISISVSAEQQSFRKSSESMKQSIWLAVANTNTRPSNGTWDPNIHYTGRTQCC